MVMVTFSGLFSLRVGAHYALERRSSSAQSLLLSARLLTVVAPALLFNYLNVCHINQTQFEAFMNRIGDNTVYLVPVCMAIIMCVNQWGLWSRIMIKVGLEELALTTIHDPDRVKSGK